MLIHMKRFRFNFRKCILVVCIMTITIILHIINFNLYQKSVIGNKKIKYVVYECINRCGGWGDRSKGIMTAYALSLLTNRNFLIKFNRRCSFTNFIEPNEIDWRFNLSESSFKKMSKFELPIYWDKYFVKKRFTNMTFLESTIKQDIILVRTGFNLVKYLTLNKNHHKRIRNLGYSVKNFNLENVYAKWYKKLFKLTKNNQLKYEQILKKHEIDSENNLVCAQIRIGDFKMEQFTSVNNTKFYWNFIIDKFLNNNLNSSYKLFITSDRFEIYEDARTVFDKNKLIVIPFTSHIEMTEEFIHKEHCDEISKLYLNFEMLSKCTKAVISYSAFGMYGVLRKEDKNFDNVYIYTNVTALLSNFWKRDSLDFVKFDRSQFYLDFDYFDQKIKL